LPLPERIHAVRIPFRIPVSPDRTIDRDAYAYIVFGERVTLIDSGVAGAEALLFEYIRKNGRDPKDLSLLILTHSHPDHIGSARAIQAATQCRIAAHAGEKDWIEDTDRQFRERPVPGFPALVGWPAQIDRLLADGERVDLGNGMVCEVMHTPGHSRGSISLLFRSENVLITGDALPVPGDLPIYENITTSIATIERLKNIQGIETLLSSFEAPVQGQEAVRKRIDESLAWLRRIHETVIEAAKNGEKDPMELCRKVVGGLGLPPFAANPLVARAFASSLQHA
jgi:hydroxyacylglutathione hydrolase